MYRLGYKRLKTFPVPLELTVKGLLSPVNSLPLGWAQVWEPGRMKRTLLVDQGEKGILDRGKSKGVEEGGRGTRYLFDLHGWVRCRVATEEG